MPKLPMDYSKTHFYKIVCNDLSIKDCYVGHTLNFVQRKWRHSSDCKNENSKMYNCKVHKFIRENGDWENWSMILIDTMYCEDILDALRKEREFVEKYNANLNKQIPSRTKEEWCKDNSECLKNRSSQFYQNNKEHCKERNKKYRENHKERLNQFAKDYREKNKECISLKRGEKIMCECGSTVSKRNFARHLKNNKPHQHYINSLQD